MMTGVLVMVGQLNLPLKPPLSCGKNKQTNKQLFQEVAS